MAYTTAEYTNRPLIEEERAFAEEHHYMIYFYANKMNLNIDEWYDYLVIPYLNAVKKYHTYEPCKQYSFSTVLKTKLKTEVGNEFRRRNRLKNKPKGGIYSLNEMLEGDNPFSEYQLDVWWIDKTQNVERYVIEKEFLYEVYHNTEKYENTELLKLILIMASEGYSVIEIAEQARKEFREEFYGCTQKDVERVIRALFSKKKKHTVQKLVEEIFEQYN